MVDPRLLIELRQKTNLIRKLSYDLDSSISLGHQQIDRDLYLKDYQKLTKEFEKLQELAVKLL